MIDLHLHLDGSMSLRCAKKIINENGFDKKSDDELLALLQYKPGNSGSLTDYLKCFDYPLKLMQSPENVRYTSMMLLEDLANEKVTNAEIRFAPQFHVNNGFSQEDILCGAIDALDYGMLMDVSAGYILCLMRGTGNELANEETLELAKKYLGRGVVGIDLAGDESKYPVENYKEYFDFARKHEIPITIHAGEAAGPESIERSIEYGARRIGHGIAAIEDKLLMKELVNKGIALEMCPISNLQTGACENIKDYPLVDFLNAGIKVTVNTDNRMVSNTNLRKEFEILKNVPGYEAGMERILLENAQMALF